MAQPQQSPKCHLSAVMHLLPLVHKWETRLPVAQTKFKTEQSKGLLFSLVKKFQLRPCYYWLVMLTPQACFWSKTLPFGLEKLEVTQPLASSMGFPTDVASMPAKPSLPAARERTAKGPHCRMKSPRLSCANSPGQICLGHGICNQGSAPEGCEYQHIYLAVP